MPSRIDALEDLEQYELDLLIKQAQDEEMEAYNHYLETGEIRYLDPKGGIQLEDTVKIKYVKGKGFSLSFPNVDGVYIESVVSEAAVKTLENVMKIRRLHGASEVTLPVGASAGRLTNPKDK